MSVHSHLGTLASTTTTSRSFSRHLRRGELGCLPFEFRLLAPLSRWALRTDELDFITLFAWRGRVLPLRASGLLLW